MSQILLDPKVWAALIGLVTILVTIWNRYLSRAADFRRLQKKIKEDEALRDAEHQKRIVAETMESNESIDEQDKAVQEWWDEDTEIVDPFEMVDSRMTPENVKSNGALSKGLNLQVGVKMKNPLDEKIWGAVCVAAKHYNLPVDLVAAMVMVESGGDPFAMRFEPRWKHVFDSDKFAKQVGSSKETEEIAQMTSWGICQVMGTVAREYGHKGFLSELCLPEKSLHYGCVHLKRKLEKFGEIEGVAAYNSGSPRKDDNGVLHNQDYVDKILKWRGEFSMLNT